MFETVAPETFSKRSRRVLYESLPVSLALHGVVAAAAVAAAVWNVAFPSQSPRVVRAYQLVSIIPDPPPPPPPPAPPKAVTQPVRQVTTMVPQQDVAPTVIPDVIPIVTREIPKSIITAGVVGGIEGGVPGGTVGGSPEGVHGGDVGGTKGGTIGGIVTDNRVHIERDKPLPLYPVSQVYPQYPEDARLRHWEDSLVVRYVIGMDGRVKEVTVISAPERPIFAEAAVKAIRTWRFRPYVKDGQAQEVVHELTVNFVIESTG